MCGFVFVVTFVSFEFGHLVFDPNLDVLGETCGTGLSVAAVGVDNRHCLIVPVTVTHLTFGLIVFGLVLLFVFVGVIVIVVLVLFVL